MRGAQPCAGFPPKRSQPSLFEIIFTRQYCFAMFALSLTVLASAWMVCAQDNDAYHPHGAFAFVRSGERTPSLTGDSQVLTAVGAQQMYQLGQNLRARWIGGDSNTGLGRQNIANMSVDMLNNDQISIQTLDTQYLVVVQHIDRLFAMFCLPSPVLLSPPIHLALRFWPNWYICCAPTAVKTWLSPVRDGVHSPDRIKAKAPWGW